jgi:SSS family solute:Na+ symporter/sodium/pantothenate symporter
VLVIGGFTLVDGNLAAVTEHLLANEPAKAAVPPLEVSTGWLSLVLIVGFGAAVYPHAIQRIYAAGSERTLKRSLGFMALMPPITAGAVFLVGIIGIDLYPGRLGAAELLVDDLPRPARGVHQPRRLEAPPGARRQGR